MFSYSSPELIDAEVRYRRERAARDWTGSFGTDVALGTLAQRARSAFSAVGHLGTSARRHRPA